MGRNKKYDVEFKKNIVEMYQEGKAPTEIVREYGISNSVLYKWLKEYGKIKAEDGTTVTLNEMKALKKQNAQLKMENEILKKAIAIFTPKP